jgi:hypothetical protein
MIIFKNSAIWFHIGLGFLLPTMTVAGQTDDTTYRNSRDGYTLQVPRHWHISVTDHLAVLYNYPASEGGPQGLFPLHGANIFVVPFASVSAVSRASSMQEWIQENLRDGYSNIVVRSVPSIGLSDRLPQNVIRVESDYQRSAQDDSLQHKITYYFTLHGSWVKIELVYWKDDEQSAHFRSALDFVLRSVRSEVNHTRVR